MFDIFSPYANPFEKKVNKYFSRLSEKHSSVKTKTKMVGLMQENLVVFQLWSECRYKGYKYLNKHKRRELYQNTEYIKNDFEEYCQSNPVDINNVYAELKHHNVDIRNFSGKEDQLKYLACIMQYLAPKGGKYDYRASSNFGLLLCDPTTEKMIGDCNQIVTLYIYFYSLKYDITDLEILTYPGHVALHFNGVDLEATNGRFTSYDKKGQTILPIHEIVAINLLDTTDSYFKTHKLNPDTMLESAKIAYLVSSNRNIVDNNLKVAYHNIINQLVKNNNYSLALTYAKQNRDHKLINFVGHNATVYYMKKNNFTTARKFAKHMDKPRDFLNSIDYNEGVVYLNKGDYNRALTIFKRMNNSKLVKQCYIGLYSKEQKKLSHIKTIPDLKKHRTTINKLNYYAQKSGDPKLSLHAKKLQQQI